jgi:hypothetical protein
MDRDSGEPPLERGFAYEQEQMVIEQRDRKAVS